MNRTTNSSNIFLHLKVQDALIWQFRVQEQSVSTVAVIIKLLAHGADNGSNTVICYVA